MDRKGNSSFYLLFGQSLGISCILLLLRPAYGGRDCPSSAFDYQICNTEECAGPYEDFRAQQCIQRSNKYHKNIKHSWLPYEHPDGKSVPSVSLIQSYSFISFAKQQEVRLHLQVQLLSSIYRLRWVLSLSLLRVLLLSSSYSEDICMCTWVFRGPKM